MEVCNRLVKVCVLSLLLWSAFAFAANIINVSSGGSIQAAINAANPGDTIIVAAGTYRENLNITKSITIRGVDRNLVILEPTVAGYGIGIAGAGNTVTIENITINAGSAQYFMVHVSGISEFTIENVKIKGAGKTVTPGGQPLGGLDLNGVSNVVIRDVEISDVSRNGVSLTNSLTNTVAATLGNVNVHDTGISEGWAGVAIYTTQVGNFSVNFTGTNTVTNTPKGIYIEDVAGATVSLTALAGTVVFSGQTVAPLVKFGPGSTPNLDNVARELGLVGKVYSPEASSPYNTGVAFFATVEEALGAAVVNPALAPYTVVYDLASNQFVVGPGMQIQRALNVAQNGDVILVKPGTYVDQQVIDESLTLQGSGWGTSGTIIQAPNTLTQYFTTGTYKNCPIIYVHDADNVTIRDLVVDGAGKGNANYRFIGIAYYNAGGTIDHVEIVGIRDTPLSGAQHGVGIYAYNADGTPRTLTISDSFIHDFQKNGMVLRGDGLTVRVEGNTVVGVGPTDRIAQNGIQIGYGATGVISGNLVTQCWFNNSDWTATGILVVSTDNVVVESNTVVDNESGIAVAGFGALGWPSSNNNVVRGNDVIGNAWGVDIQMDANNTFVIYNNIVNNTEAGVSVTQFIDDPVFKGYEPVGTVIRYNRIVDNKVGVENNDVSTNVDAALNWWGSATGPTHASNPGGTGDPVTDKVIYSPWLGTDPDGDPSRPGVQVTGPVRIVVDDVGPAPAGGYLNQAIAGANELPYADTIEVRHGTYNASTPITGPVTLISQPGSTTNTFLNGNLTLSAAGILIGRMGQGFTINADITVTPGTDASTIHINWNDIYGTVTNNGVGTLDATYNWWGGRYPATAVVGAVNYYPYLPLPVSDMLKYMSDHGVDADTAIFLIERGGLVSEGLLVLSLMNRFGLSRDEAERVVDEFGFLRVGFAFDRAFDYDDFVRLLLGYGATPAGGAGAFVDRGVAGGAGMFGDRVVDAVYEIGQPILVSFELSDFQGNPVTGIGAWVTLVQLHEDGHQTIWYWNATRYNPETGLQELSIPTEKLPEGYFLLVINFRDGTKTESLIQIVK
jgi:hypothetical protein